MRFLFILISITGAICESTITVLGVPFPVEKFEQVDEQNVVVTISGVSRLLSKEKLDDWVVSNGLSLIQNPTYLGDFAKRASSSGRKDWAAKSIQILCDEGVRLSGKDLIVRDVISQLSDIGPYAKNLDPECAKEIFLNPDLPAPSQISILYKLGALVKEEAQRRVAEYLMEGKSPDRLVSRMLELYGETDIEVSTLKQNLGSFDQLKDAIARGSFSEAQSIVDRLKLTNLAAPVNEMLHEQAKEAKSPGRTLQILSLVISTRPSTFEILGTAVENLSSTDISVLSSDRVLNFARKSEGFSKKIAGIVKDSLKINSFLVAEEGIRALVKVSSFEGEKLAIKMIEKQRALGLFAEAERTASLINRSLTLPERLRLFLLTDGWLLGLTGLSLALLLLLLRVRRKRKKTKPKSPPIDEIGPKFVTMGRATGFDRRKDEYATLLEFFGLSGQVTEREIKNAFRKKIKEVHPDVVEGQDQNFLKTKESYERLLELHNAFNRG